MKKVQTGIYMLNDEHVFFNEKTRRTNKEDITPAYLNRFLLTKKYDKQKVQSGLSAKYNIVLYYNRNDKLRQSNWKAFLTDVAQAGEDVLVPVDRSAESFLLFFFDKTTGHNFVCTGGYGHLAIQDLIAGDFGIDILSRIVEPTEKALRIAKERSLTGGIQGLMKVFRNGYNFYDNDSFGNIYSELSAALTTATLNKSFGLASKKGKKESICVAKNSFAIRKALSFAEIVNLVERCEHILTLPQLTEVNNVEKLGKSQAVVIDKLWDSLFKKIHDAYKHGKEVDVEISPKEFDQYFLADTYSVVFTADSSQLYVTPEPVRSLTELLREIHNLNPGLKENELRQCLISSVLESRDGEGVELTSDTIKNHFCTELTHGGKSYFLIDRNWYLVKPNFLDKLNEHCQDYIKNGYYTGPKISPWPYPKVSEGVYNESYHGAAQTLVFDRFTPDGIEVCDFMKWDKDTVYLYHVKAGFDGSMRDLCNQVLISARKMKEDIALKRAFLRNLYVTVTTNTGISSHRVAAKKHTKIYNEKDFVDLFTSKRIVYVLTVLDTATTKRELKTEITKFDSNIAKFALSELHRSLRSLDMPFQICQLTKI